MIAAGLVAAGCRTHADSAPSVASPPASITASSGASLEGVSTPSTPAAAAPARSTCSPARPQASGDSDVSLETADGTRRYVLHVPPAYDGSRALPLVVNLHGAGSNAAQQIFYSGFNKKADAAGFVTITPDALGTPQAWNFIPLSSGADDVGFIRAAIDRTERDLCIDPARVYATGISSGAAMAVRLACSLQDRIAAIGIVAALWYPPDCPTAKAMPVLEFHGTDDPVVPFKGGKVATSTIPAPAVEDSAAAWAKADGCNPAPATARPAAHVRTLAYSECRNFAAVVLYIVEGGGHTWPGASVDVNALGATSHEISATDEIWSFFAAN